MDIKRSSNSSSLDGSNSTALNSTQPAGSDFKDPILVAAIVVNGVCAFSFASLMIAALWIKGKKEHGRKAFGVLAGLLGAMFLSFVDATGIGIAVELESTISFIPIVLSLVKNTIDNGTDTTLIFVIYNVITNRFAHVRRGHDGNISLWYIHFGMAAITALLGIADAAIGDYAQILMTSDDADDDNTIKFSKLYGKIHLAYTSVYCVVALEILACAVFILKKSKITGTESRVITYLMAMVTPFLVIRSIAALALGVIYIYLANDQQNYTGLANAALLGITSIFIYSGLVFTGFQKDWNLQDGFISTVDVQQEGSRSAFIAPTERQTYERTIH